MGASYGCFEEGRSIRSRCKAKAGEDGDPGQLAERFYTNLNRLRNVREADYPCRRSLSADIDEAIDVFDRVNSLWHELGAADLALVTSQADGRKHAR